MKKTLYFLFFIFITAVSIHSNAQERSLDTSMISISVDRDAGTLIYQYKKFLQPFDFDIFLYGGKNKQYHVIHGEAIWIKLSSEPNSAYVQILSGSVIPGTGSGATGHQLSYTTNYNVTNIQPLAWKTADNQQQKTTNQEFYARMQFNDLPAKYFNEPITIKMTARNCHYQLHPSGYHYGFGGNGCGTGTSDYVKSLTISTIGAPQNLQATTSQNCLGAPISWTVGANMSGLSPARYQVKRKVANTGDPYTVITTTSATNYLDTSASAGTEYEYKVQSGLDYGGNRTIYTAETPVAVRGSKLGLTTAPKGLFIDQANCNGHLDINWNYAGTSNPPLFEIKKATDVAFTANVTTEEVSGSDRSWRDVNATSGTTYFYAVQGKAGCPNAPSTSTYSALSNTESEIGNGTPSAPVVSGISTNATNKSVTLNWQDNTSLEHSYKVIRISGNGSTEFQVGKNTTSYTDNSAQACENYTYQVKAINDQCAVSGVLSTNDTTAYIPANISSTFNTTHKLEATDGDFGDRIELRWTATNRQNENWYIERKNLSNNTTVQVASVSGGSRFYADNSADANTLYEYKIFGDLDCAGNVLTSDSTKDVGFRLAFGTINGQITYSGGTAVKGVKVTAEPASGASGQSGEFNGTSTYAAVANKEQLNTNEVTATAFIRPHSNSGRRTIIDKTDGTKGYLLTLEGNQLKGKVGTQELAANIPNFSVNNWMSVGLAIDNDTLKLFANGTSIGTWKHNQQGKVNLNDGIQIGRDGTNAYFDGEIDEVRIYNRALSNLEIARSFDVYINPSANGLVGYWRFDEGFGNTAYDYSKTVQNNNKNHASLHQVIWSNQKPSISQLTAGAYTNELGSYFIPFIPYLGSGDNYTITPTFGTHSFTPATTTLLIGSGSSNYTGQNFLDNSSFAVSGTVQFKNTSCIVKDARLKIDGEVVIRNGEIARTDGNGVFNIQVPIGPHVVSVEQTSHVYSAGRFPAAGTYDFQQNVTGIQFIDSTLVKVVGRVAGGGIQKALPPGLGRGKNNIGSAKIPFKAQQGNGCLVDTAISNASTGEYLIQLPPLRYEVPIFSIPSQQSIEFRDNSLLDLSTVPPVQVSKDSVFNLVNNRKVLDRVDSIEYQTQRDFIYKVSPKINVEGKKVANIYGADTLRFDDAGNNVVIPISAGIAGKLNHSVFYENDNYNWLISAFEIYENHDIPSQTKFDSVPMVEGDILITNNLANKVGKRFEYGIQDSVLFNGIQEYSFSAGQANTTVDGLDPNNNFTKTCEITLLPTSGNAVSWKPGNEFFRGIIFGAKALGNSFSTSGPDVVTMILRDPPGTESSASWEAGTTVTSVKSWENAGGVGLDLNKNVSIGTKFTVGLGYSTPTSIENDLNFNTQIETSVNEQGELIEEKTTSVTISTGDGDEFVGGNADLFFGRAMNMDFGLSEVLTLIDDTKCGGNARCYGNIIIHNGKDYRIGTINSMFAIPQGYETEFVYTQAGIENSVIPNLIALRNQLLTTHPDYTSNLTSSDLDYGKSNDDPSLRNPTIDFEFNSKEDGTGDSYTYNGYRTDTISYNDTISYIPLIINSKPLIVTLGVDSVWWFNKQIRLWEETLADNERAKVLSTGTPQRNISYQGGSAISYSSSTTRTESKTTTVNFNFSEDLTLKIGAKIGGAGVEIEQGASLFYNHASTFGSSSASTTTFEYTISDPDADDNFSVNVFDSPDGFGPIFKTRAGATSCPYQGETKTKYFQPGTILDQATVQLEKPQITASPTTLFNIPANGQGNITLNLSNGAPVDAVFSLKVLENTNPNGAIIKIDGIDPNRDFAVTANTSITKTLVVEKGPNHIKYDSIGLVFHSRCQYAFGTAAYEDIADTVYVSVNFLPSCTDLNIQVPQNQFVANSSFDNELPIIISGYDINYGGLEKIQLQYKPSNQASWIPLGREWFMDTNNVFVRYPNHPDPQEIPKNQSYISYQLEIDQLIDQNYDLKAISTCKIPQNPLFNQESSVISGVFDRVNPHPFGSPSPADGVLDPNDDISIRFNEVIEAGSLTPNNFQITGVLNGQELRHDKAVAFDGSTGYMEIANGFDFASANFTIEFWAKRGILGTDQTIISQGANGSNLFSIGFDIANKVVVSIGSQHYSSDFSITDTANWLHYSVTYNKLNLELEITLRSSQNSQVSTNNNFFTDFTSGGKTFVGKNSSSNANFFSGSIHQLRIWNKVLTSGEVSSRISQSLHGREAGLIGYWPMDEGRGVLAEDKARFRHAEMKANWEINPKSTAVQFDGMSKYAVVDSAGTLAINQEMDLSIEFWFKTLGGRLQTFLSNGGGMFTTNEANRNGWNIEMNAQNEIWVKNDSFAFRAVSSNFADNKWHHFALVVNRLANTTAFIDGAQQRTISSSNFWGFGAAKLAVGARYSINGNQETFDQYFSGNMDEVRIWNTALLRDNIELNRFNRMNGDEFGLLAYYPFESYRLELGVPVLDVSMANQSSVLSNPQRINAKAVNGSVFSTEAPPIALQRPVEKIKYSWSVNGDEIVITPNEQPENIENVTLNVSVKGIRDLRGNAMQSPKTWVAFVNKNQVLWQDAEKNLKKKLNDTLTFTSRVVNSGGELKNFTISNLPSWLTATPSSGTINPLSTRTISFTVNQGVNIGNYTEDILLATDFGFNEKLTVNLKVSKESPNFMVDPSLYQQSMSIIGQIRINGKFSTNADDKLVAFINGEVRGVTNLQYVPTYDTYLAFLDVYSNSADSVYFQIWNASQGQLHADIQPVLYFTNNSLIGSPRNPQPFDAINNISLPIALKSGWNWVSFPLLDTKMSSFYNFFEGLNFQNGDIVKTVGNNAIAQYGGSTIGWSGNLVNEGLKNDLSYLIRVANADTIDYKGLAIDPDTVLIDVQTGWNRIGFVSLRNMQLSTALANFNATDGDIIKSQERFSYFDSNLGWIGSLQTLEPTKGYLLKSSSTTNFVYPRLGLLRIKETLPAQLGLSEMLSIGYQLSSNQYEAGVGAMVKVEVCEEVLKSNNIVLAAFIGEELRGWSESATFLNDELGYQYFITAYGEGNDQFEYALIDTLLNERISLSGTLVYSKNGVEGSPTNPVIIFPKDEVDCDRYQLVTAAASANERVIYPNPFRKELYVTVPSNIGERVEVSLIDSYGRVLHQEFAAQGSLLNWNSIAGSKEVGQGVYFIRFSTDEGTQVEKAVKY